MSDDEKKTNKDYGYDERTAQRGEGPMGGLHIGARTLLLMAGGAAGALAALGFDRFTRKVRPAAIGAVREGYAFKEWVTGKAEKIKEDVEDIVAEAVYEYEKDQEAAVDTTRREEELLEKIGKIVEERLGKIQAQKKEGEQ